MYTDTNRIGRFQKVVVSKKKTPITTAIETKTNENPERQKYQSIKIEQKIPVYSKYWSGVSVIVGHFQNNGPVNENKKENKQNQ